MKILHPTASFFGRLILLFICVTALNACNSGSSSKSETATEGSETDETWQVVREVNFEVKLVDTALISLFEDSVMHWISVDDTTDELDRLLLGEEVVVENGNATLLIDYPLSQPVEIPIMTRNQGSFTRKELAWAILSNYQRIFKEEEKSATVKTLPMDKRNGLSNRNQTNGKYGICCHDIGDLVLSSATIMKSKAGQWRVELIIES